MYLIIFFKYYIPNDVYLAGTAFLLDCFPGTRILESKFSSSVRFLERVAFAGVILRNSVITDENIAQTN